MKETFLHQKTLFETEFFKSAVKSNLTPNVFFFQRRLRFRELSNPCGKNNFRHVPFPLIKSQKRIWIMLIMTLKKSIDAKVVLFWGPFVITGVFEAKQHH